MWTSLKVSYNKMRDKLPEIWRSYAVETLDNDGKNIEYVGALKKEI